MPHSQSPSKLLQVTNTANRRGSNWVHCRLMGWLLQPTEPMRLEAGQSQWQWMDSLGVDTGHTNSWVTACSPATTVTENLGKNQCLTPKVHQSN